MAQHWTNIGWVYCAAREWTGVPCSLSWWVVVVSHVLCRGWWHGQRRAWRHRDVLFQFGLVVVVGPIFILNSNGWTYLAGQWPVIILLYQVHLKPLPVRFKAIRLSELGLCSYKYFNVAETTFTFFSHLLFWYVYVVFIFFTFTVLIFICGIYGKLKCKIIFIEYFIYVGLFT